MLYLIFSLYAMQKKATEKLNAPICYKTKKTHLGHLSKNPSARFFPKKFICINFKPLCCCKFMQKMAKVPCT